MGVENLYSNVRASLREKFKFNKVNPRMRDDYDYKEIVFDGTCWLWNFMKGDYLMDYNQLRIECQQMVNNFKRFGFKLIVFMDANICRNKIDSWLQRRANRAHYIFDLNQILIKQKGDYPAKGKKDRYWFANNGCYFFVGQVFKSCGCEVYYAQIDADREMIGYVKLHKDKVYGVCGVDSDFLIFDVEIYLEMNSMNFQNHQFIITGFRHSRFLKRYQLKQHHCSQLAAIMGCDVLSRSDAYISMISRVYRNHSSYTHTEVDIIAKYLRDLEKNERRFNHEAKSEPQKKKQKKHKIMNPSTVRYNKNILRKFAISKTFYTPIYPLNVLDSPYLINLLFQDYSDCDIEREEMKKNEDSKYWKGVILDACMDDTSLLFPNECSAVVLSELRKYLYFELMKSDDALDNIEFKEIVCFPFKKYEFNPSLIIKKWRRGNIVKLKGCDKENNPFYKLKCYAFAQALEDNERNTIRIDCIPPGVIVDDIVYLLKYLHQKHLDNLKNEEESEKNDKLGNETKESNKRMNEKNEVSTVFVPSSKNSKQNRKKKLQQSKRQQALAMLNNRNVSISSGKPKKESNLNKGIKKHKLWEQFNLVLESFTFQWKYRNIFLGKPYRNKLKYPKSKCNEFRQKYQKKMTPISMHFQSIISGIYEIIFAFLRLQTHKKWYKDLFHDTYHSKIPCLKVYDEEIEHIKSKIEEWKQSLLKTQTTEIHIPYCWDVFNVKLFHWIFHNHGTAKKWIKECTQ